MARTITWYWLGRSNYSAGYPGVLHVRLIKDPELKAQELVKSHGTDSQSALDFIEREENDSRRYIRHYFEEDWANPALYDIVIDMGKVSPEDAISLIAQKWEEKQAGWRICRGPVRPP
jgi:cytidylate kinase